jgi:hypothetical protein
MLEWVHEPAALGNPDAAVSVGAGGTLFGLAILGLAIYGAVVLIRKA